MCLNGGTCSENSEGITCECTEGWTGALCQTGMYNRGFARRGTHLCAHDFAKSLGFLMHSAVWRKNNKNARTFDLTSWKDLKFHLSVCADLLVTRL